MKTKSTPGKPPVGKQTSAAGSQGVSGPRLNLYWVTTGDHEEDWFIFARTRRSAASFHERYEGYGTYDATARTILTNAHLAKYKNGTSPCHAQAEDLLALGFEILDRPKFAPAVSFRGELFREGRMEALVRRANDNYLEAAGNGRHNGTKSSSRK